MVVVLEVGVVVERGEVMRVVVVVEVVVVTVVGVVRVVKMVKRRGLYVCLMTYGIKPRS